MDLLPAPIGHQGQRRRREASGAIRSSTRRRQPGDAVERQRLAGRRGAGPAIVEVSASPSASAPARRCSDVSIAIPAGDSRALVGRNGAGKSTLVGVLTGLLAPDAGRVRFGGEEAPGLAERAEMARARRLRLPEVDRDPDPDGGGEPVPERPTDRRRGWIRWARAAAGGGAGAGGLGDRDRRRARTRAELTVEQRQIVEIARALLQGTRFIILDEPTAQLEGREVARLFERIIHLQDGGVTFLYISHHLEEIYEVCRSVTVLRDGAWWPRRRSTKCRRSAWSPQWWATPRARRRARRRPAPDGAGARRPALEVRELHRWRGF